MHLVINFSGGKDSTAMLAYIMEKYPNHAKSVVGANTGWEHKDWEPWCRSVVEDRFGLPFHVVRNPNKTFLEMVQRRGKFPAPAQRQCTSDLKRGPIQTWVRNNVADRLIVNCMGLRAAESPARAKKRPLSRDLSMTNSKRTVWNWLPIHDWSEERVRTYMAERNLPLHPVYQYLNRFSCRICIYMTKRDLAAVAVHDPEAFQIISDLEKKIGFTIQPGRTIEEAIQTS